jgi:hypothetical protein
MISRATFAPGTGGTANDDAIVDSREPYLDRSPQTGLRPAGNDIDRQITGQRSANLFWQVGRASH